MPTKLRKTAPPDNDKRWKIVDVTMRRNGYTRDALIETLHAVQNSFGYLDDVAMRYVARSLQVPYSKVYGVATFYHLFTLKPQGKHTCVVCTGTACFIKGARELIQGLKDTYNVKPGETTEDRQLSLVSARCLGTCGLAPAVVVDGAFLGNQTRAGLLSKITEATSHAS